MRTYLFVTKGKYAILSAWLICRVMPLGPYVLHYGRGLAVLIRTLVCCSWRHKVNRRIFRSNAFWPFENRQKSHRFSDSTDDRLIDCLSGERSLKRSRRNQLRPKSHRDSTFGGTRGGKFLMQQCSFAAVCRRVGRQDSKKRRKW